VSEATNLPLPKVSVQDVNGNVVTSDTGNVTSVCPLTYSPWQWWYHPGRPGHVPRTRWPPRPGCSFVNCQVTGTACGRHLHAQRARAVLSSTTSTNVVITAGAATRLVFSGQPSSGQNIQATGTGSFPVSVAVQDANGNVEIGDNFSTVNLAINNNGGSGGVLYLCQRRRFRPVTVSGGVAASPAAPLPRAVPATTITGDLQPQHSAGQRQRFNITPGRYGSWRSARSRRRGERGNQLCHSNRRCRYKTSMATW